MCFFNSLPKIKLAEVMQHRSKDSFWIIWKNKVYDITDFYYKHPGGPCILVNLDATPHMKFHSNNAKKFLKKRLIGNLLIQ
jgi:cytochrome b involved in lipid metabolism